MYLASFKSSSLTVFDRDPATGAVSYSGCYTNGFGCGGGVRDGVVGLGGASGVVVSADGRLVWVAGHENDGVIWFERNPTTLALTQGGCLTQAMDACGGERSERFGLDGANNLVLSADGRDLFVASESGSLADIGLDPATGLPISVSCFTSQAAGCPAGRNNIPGLGGALEVAASPDGREVLVATPGNALVRFDRDPTSGALAHRGCYTEESGCGVGRDGFPGLTGNRDVAFSPDGESVYVASVTSVVALDRDPATGDLSEVGCFTSFSGCGSGRDGISTLAQGWRLVLSPDGRSLYNTASTGVFANAVVRFDRALDAGPACAPVPAQRTPKNVALPIDLPCDEPNGQSFTRGYPTPPAHGTLLSDATRADRVVYQPARGFTGRDGFTLVATDATGHASQPVQVEIAVGVPAVATGLGLSPRRFVTFRGRGASVARKRGTTARYRLDFASKVTFRVRRETSGRRVGRRCRKPSARNRRARRCIRLVPVRGSFAQRAVAGPNSFRFTGRIARRPLRAGRYRLLATPAGGKAASTRFVVR